MHEAELAAREAMGKLGEMSEMVERVARAIAGTPDNWYDFGEEDWKKRASAAIAAMREPTKTMVDEAWRLIGSNLRYEEAYRHIVDAALKAEPATSILAKEAEAE